MNQKTMATTVASFLIAALVPVNTGSAKPLVRATQEAIANPAESLKNNPTERKANFYQSGLAHDCVSQGSRDIEKAIRWYRRSSASPSDDLDAAGVWANALANGNLEGSGVVERDPEAAFRLAKLSSEGGNAFGTFVLAELYVKGVGCRRDSVKARDIYAAAVQQLQRHIKTENDPRAQYYLATCLVHGLGVERNPTKATELLELAREQGFVPAYHALGICCANGTGVPRNESRAIRLLKEAASFGDANSMFELGRFYWPSTRIETNVPQSKQRAFDYWERAASKGCVPAMVTMAECQIFGWGTRTNLESAFEQLQKAARLGSPWAKYRLGSFFELGVAPAVQNYETAAIHYREASARGVWQAARRMTFLHLEKRLRSSSERTMLQWAGVAARAGDKEMKRRLDEVGQTLQEQADASPAYVNTRSWHPNVPTASDIQYFETVGRMTGRRAIDVASSYHDRYNRVFHKERFK